MQVIGWVAIYIVVAWLFGFWPFEEGLFTGPTSECSYDAGYDDGYDGANRKCSTKVYLAGYEDGDFDSDCYWLRCEKPDHTRFKSLGCGSWSKLKCR